jgi:hypothetical protein
VRDLYISRIGLHILLQEICGLVLGIYKSLAHRHMNVEIGTEAAQFPEKEYINGFFLAVRYLKKKNGKTEREKVKRKLLKYYLPIFYA